MEDFVKQTIFDISKTSDFTIAIMETDKDHIHILPDMSHNYSIASIVNRIKAIATDRLWKQYGLFLKKQFWKERTFGAMIIFVVLLAKQIEHHQEIY